MVRHMNSCPVCGYREMPDPPEDFNICPCCGTEFGYTDAGITYEQLREKWRAHGAPWFSQSIQPPPDWDPRRQLLAMERFAIGPQPTEENLRIQITAIGPQPTVRGK